MGWEINLQKEAAVLSMNIQYHEQTETKLKQPNLFAVVLHNDDYTPMDFVVEIIVKIFNKSSVEAAKIMMEVHEKGKSVVDVYIYDVAMTKKLNVQTISKDRGFPLKVTVEEAIL